MPNEPVLQEETTTVSETGEKYRAYFQALIDELRENHKFTNARAGQPQNWYSFASENSKVFTYSTSFARGGKVRVEIYIDGGDKEKNKRLFDCLLKSREEIESALGCELSWDRLDNRRASRVAVYRDGEIDTDSETLAEIRAWAIKKRIQQCLAAQSNESET
jgi:hypothetical protein